MFQDEIKQSGLVRKNRLADALVLALHQADAPPTLRRLAQTIEVTDTAVLYALRGLAASHLVASSQRRYELAVAEHLRPGVVFLSARRLGLLGTAFVATRASQAVEFAALVSRRLVLIYASTGTARDVAKLKRVLADAYPELQLREYEAERLRRRTPEVANELARLRRATRRSRVLKGDIGAALPNPELRGRFERARPLHRLHASVRPLSRRQRQSLARRFGVQELSIFGSAVRGDFRPDSDIDVFVRLKTPRTDLLERLTGIREALEQHFERRVDVLNAPDIPEGFRDSIERDKVTFYGKPHAKRIPSQ